MAASARFWLSTPSWSHSSRVKPSMVAIRSALMPWGTIAYWSRRWLLFAVKPSTCIGAGRDIDSTPPATTICWKPARTPIAAKFTACWPDPQKRFSVTPGASSDQPASRAAMRAMSIE